MGIFEPSMSLEDAASSLDAAVRGSRNWIGEINLSREDYQFLCRLRRESTEQRPSPALVLAATMIFTARYADEENDFYSGFWKHYARALGREETDQNFQNREREQFRKARLELMDKYGFHFPQEVRQDVVSGIYMHAVLPRYLQDDFARWLVDLFRNTEDWQHAAEASLDEIITKITEHSKRGDIVPRLRSFLQSKITQKTAADLVQTLAICADMFWNGQSVESMLAPIERELWSRLQPELEQQRQQISRRKEYPARMSARYAWDVTLNTIALFVKNWCVTSEAAPDRLIWVINEADLQDYKDYILLNPWQLTNGFKVDAVYISGTPVEGCVLALVNDHDQVIEQHRMEALPNDEVLFFKLDRRNELALYTPLATVSDGEYLISSKKDFKLFHTDGQPLEPLGSFSPPSVLAERGHKLARRYNIPMPVDLIIDDVKRPIRNRRGVFSARLEGESVPGLTRQSPSVFYHPPTLRLVNTAPIADDVAGLWLRISSSEGDEHQVKLAEMKRTPDGSDLLVELENLPVGAYKLRLLRGVKDALDEPLNLVILPPGVHIVPPSIEEYYSVQHAPSALLKGLSREQIEAPNGTVEDTGEGVVVMWCNPPHPLRLQLRLNETLVSMSWEVCWRHAWVEPSYTLLDEEDLQNVIIHLCGGRGQTFWFNVGSSARHPEELDAKGRCKIVLRNHPLRDLLSSCSEMSVEVKATDGRSTWSLFTFQRPRNTSLTVLAQRAFHVMRHLRRRVPSASARDDEFLLLAVPREQMGRALESGISPALHDILDTLRNVGSAASYLPDHLLPKLPLQLKLSKRTTISAQADQPPHLVGRAHVTAQLRVKNGHKSIPFEAEYINESDGSYKLRLRPSTATNYKQCVICSGLFDPDDRDAKLMHSHVQGLGLQHRSLSAEIPLVTCASLGDCKNLVVNPDFTVVLDQDTVQGWRLRDNLPSLQRSKLLSKQHYQFASIEWIQNLRRSEKDPRKEAIKAIKDILDPKSELFEKLISLRDRLYSCLNAEKHKSPTFAMFCALLDAVHSTNDELKYNRWLALDSFLLTAAILCRASAYNVGSISGLVTTDVENLLQELLVKALQACPQLTAWAFAWAEFYLYYFDIPSQTPEDLP